MAREGEGVKKKKGRRGNERYARKRSKSLAERKNEVEMQEYTSKRPLAVGVQV